jgi:hypothetical protein
MCWCLKRYGLAAAVAHTNAVICCGCNAQVRPYVCSKQNTERNGEKFEDLSSIFGTSASHQVQTDRGIPKKEGNPAWLTQLCAVASKRSGHSIGCILAFVPILTTLLLQCTIGNNAAERRHSASIWVLSVFLCLLGEPVRALQLAGLALSAHQQCVALRQVCAPCTMHAGAALLSCNAYVFIWLAASQGFLCPTQLHQ